MLFCFWNSSISSSAVRRSFSTWINCSVIAGGHVCALGPARMPFLKSRYFCMTRIEISLGVIGRAADRLQFEDRSARLLQRR